MKNQKISNTLGAIAITFVLAGFSSFIPSFAQETVETKKLVGIVTRDNLLKALK